jgi:uncharacterized protein with GYD domain
MARYAILFTFKGETVKAMMEKPSDRAAAAKAIIEAAGGRIESYYIMFGAWDGICIAELPNSDAAAAVSLKISSSGAFSHVQTHELKTADELVAALNTANGLAYSPPGT